MPVSGNQWRNRLFVLSICIEWDWKLIWPFLKAIAFLYFLIRYLLYYKKRSFLVGFFANALHNCKLELTLLSHKSVLSTLRNKMNHIQSREFQQIKSLGSVSQPYRQTHREKKCRAVWRGCWSMYFLGNNILPESITPSVPKNRKEISIYSFPKY
jgi:hypothetical protein